MDIHYDPPRHSPTADFAVGEIALAHAENSEARS